MISENRFLSLKLQISLRRGFIQQCHVFEALDVRSRLQLVAKLTSRIAVPQEKICLQGQRGSKMGFVARGCLSATAFPLPSVPPPPPPRAARRRSSGGGCAFQRSAGCLVQLVVVHP